MYYLNIDKPKIKTIYVSNQCPRAQTSHGCTLFALKICCYEPSYPFKIRLHLWSCLFILHSTGAKVYICKIFAVGFCWNHLNPFNFPPPHPKVAEGKIVEHRHCQWVVVLLPLVIHQMPRMGLRWIYFLKVPSFWDCVGYKSVMPVSTEKQHSKFKLNFIKESTLKDLDERLRRGFPCLAWSLTTIFFKTCTCAHLPINRMNTVRMVWMTYGNHWCWLFTAAASPWHCAALRHVHDMGTEAT